MDKGKTIVRRNKEASIAKIINAAAQLFSEKGYENTTYTEIANKANLNISLISRYFGTKEKLLQAAVNVMSSKSNYSFDKEPIKETLKEELHYITDILIDNILEHETEMKAVTNVAVNNKNFRKELYSLTDANIDIVARLQLFADKGAIHPDHNLRYAVDTFFSTVNSMVVFMGFTFGLPESNVRSRIHYLVETFADSLARENKSEYPNKFECDKE